MSAPWSAGRLVVSPSLNRAVIGTFPGQPAGLAGTTANTWLSAASVTGRRAGDRDTGLVEDELGVALGSLVATLVRGPEDARAARPDWPDERWARWTAVCNLALGGGLLAGPLGARLARTAQSWLASVGVAVTLTRVVEPERLALRGALTLLEHGDGVALDCGSTTLKAAVLGRHGVAYLAPVPTPRAPDADGIVAAIADAVAHAVAAAAGAAVPATRAVPPTADVSMCLATYLDETGQPYAGQLGPYGPLGDVALIPALRRAIRQRTGVDIAPRVTHDGWAALLGARVDHLDVDAAIVLGTSLGSALDPREVDPRVLDPLAFSRRA